MAHQVIYSTESLNASLTGNSSSRWKEFPHVLTFQSVLDSTVSTRAVLMFFIKTYRITVAELVLFDINRAVNFRALFRHSSDRALSHLLATPERTFTTTIVKRLFREHEDGGFDTLSTHNNSRRSAT
jgi:hypothetical protein